MPGTCPHCGATIHGLEAAGPGLHSVAPCGHFVDDYPLGDVLAGTAVPQIMRERRSTVQAAGNDLLIPDGGTEQFVDDRGPEDRHTHAEDAENYEDGCFTRCPIRGCGGELWYPSTPLGDAVVCDDCDRHFAHYYYPSGVNKLLDPAGSGEVLATVYDPENDDRDPDAGGGSQ